MRRQSRLIMTTLAASITLTAANAQGQTRQDQEDVRSSQDHMTQQDQTRMQSRSQMHSQMMMLHHADDELINASVTNLQQESLGNIAALVVDLQSAQVTYAIVSFGGFLGIGDEMHAVPWNAFSFRPLYDGLVLDVSRDQLERQQAFPRDQMPNFSDRQWGQELHQAYGTQPYWEQQRTGQRQWDDDEDMNMQRPSQRQTRTMDDDEPTYPGMESQQFITTYELVNMTVENRQGENIGTINDFAVNLQTGEIEHVVMGYGGWLGIGETNTALPLHVFQPRDLATDSPVMILDITQDQLRGAPEYRVDRWPRADAASWAQNLGAQPTR